MHAPVMNYTVGFSGQPGPTFHQVHMMPARHLVPREPWMAPQCSSSPMHTPVMKYTVGLHAKQLQVAAKDQQQPQCASKRYIQ